MEDPCEDPGVSYPVICQVTSVYHGPHYSEWDLIEKPESWATLRQCHGEADNSTESYGRGSYVWVGLDDIGVLAIGFRAAQYNPATDPDMTDPSTGKPWMWLAADFDHFAESYGRGNVVRVGLDDISELGTYFRVQEPPNGMGVPTDCQD